MTDTVTTLSPIGLILLFGLGKLIARFVVVYRRNNLAAGCAALVSTAGCILWGWSGLAAFIAGTLLGAWIWVHQIRRANANVSRAQNPSVRYEPHPGSTAPYFAHHRMKRCRG